MIRNGSSKPVGAGGLVRLVSLAAGLVFFGWLGTSVVHIEPAAIAVLAMLVSVTAEAAAVLGWTNRILRMMPETTPGTIAPTYRDVWQFFFPLGATSIMTSASGTTLPSDDFTTPWTRIAFFATSFSGSPLSRSSGTARS